MTISAFICGCAGLDFTAWEQDFLRDAQPWGLIVFKRNVENPAQLARLTASFRNIVGRSDAPVFVDQEGGRVQRLGPPHWPAYPAAANFLAAGQGLDEAAELVELAARLIARDLRLVGISADCLPVLDVREAGTHQVIGNRAYSDDPATVARLGRAAADGLLACGVLPVMKHMPGHGRTRADTHFELPFVDASLAELESSDFVPFRANADLPIGMSAHLVYRALDPDRPGTTSPVIIDEIIRQKLGFDGLLMTDDLSMQALAGTLAERAEAAFRAGIDVALHSNGDPAEMQEVASAAPVLAGPAFARAQSALAWLREPDTDFDPVDARRRLQSALAVAA
ncbi:MAG: beta-N-acetylhexosaminidase [Beijerinckiaceae bacterium]